MLLSDTRVQFFGGKGGVGKTTLAAACALAAADTDRRTLLVSTDPAHSTSDVLESPLGPEPRPVARSLWAMEIDPTVEADRYVADVKARIQDTTPPRLWREVERQIDVARVSPGAQEAALFERVARILETDAATYERLIFDTAPTGQTLQLLSLPEMMQAWVAGLIGRRRKLNAAASLWRGKSGPARGGGDGRSSDPVLVALQARQERFVRARTLLTDASTTAFHFVVLPERLPILETERAVAALDRYRIPVGSVLVNRVLPSHAQGAFLSRRRARQQEYLAEIGSSFPHHPVFHVPLQERDVVGLPALRALMATIQPAPPES